MSTTDFGMDALDMAPSVDVQPTLRGYVIRAMEGGSGLRDLVRSGVKLLPFGAGLQSAYEVEVDTTNRVFHIFVRSLGGTPIKQQSLRFEEVKSLGLEDGSMIGDLRASLSRWDYCRITVTKKNSKTLRLIGGDLSDLEPLVVKLRRQVGVA